MLLKKIDEAAEIWNKTSDGRNGISLNNLSFKSNIGETAINRLCDEAGGV